MRKAWEQWEFDFIRDNFEIIGQAACMERLGRTRSSVNYAARKMGITQRGPSRKPRILIDDGYIRISAPGYDEFLHRVLMEQKLGRKLTSDEIVHHIDGNKMNNHPDNLTIESRSSHMKEHYDDRLKDKWNRFI